VEDSVIFGDVVVRRGARVRTAVVDERCEVLRGAVVGAKPRGRVARDEDLVVVGRDTVCGGELEPGARLEPGTRC
jgi:glucose-1-phosphate adenylyltransferase